MERRSEITGLGGVAACIGSHRPLMGLLSKELLEGLGGEGHEGPLVPVWRTDCRGGGSRGPGRGLCAGPGVVPWMGMGSGGINTL